MFFNELNSKTLSLHIIPRQLSFDSIPPNGNASSTLDLSDIGYNPVGVVGWSNVVSASFYIYQALVENKKLTTLVKNISENEINNAGVSFWILCTTSVINP